MSRFPINRADHEARVRQLRGEKTVEAVGG
jgi:hypothetical protein